MIQIQAGINSARGDDTKDLKPAILDLIPQKYLSGPANEDGEKSIWSLVPTNARTEKGLRGFANRITGRLLCPIDYVRDFDADPNEFVFSLPASVAEAYPSPQKSERSKNSKTAHSPAWTGKGSPSSRRSCMMRT